MEIKKSPKADLESKKSTWLLVGYVIVLAFMFVAFEWTKRDIKIDTSQAITDVFFEEEIIPITEQPEQVTPPPPEAPSIAETLTIVEDDADVEETAIVSSEELNQAVEIKYVPVAVEEEEPDHSVSRKHTGNSQSTVERSQNSQRTAQKRKRTQCAGRSRTDTGKPVPKGRI